MLKKNIGIITHYDVHNHGAVLQLMALKKVLESENETYNAGALTFVKDLRYIEKSLQAKYNLSIKSLWVYAKYLLQKGLFKTLYNFKKYRTLNRFKSKNHLILGGYGDSNIEIAIIGSDEVFSTKGGISKEFFNIESPYQNVLSYAASFGNTTYNDLIEKQEFDYVKNGIKTISKVSVRDYNSYEILSRMDISGQIVCDPVILYGYKQEIATAKKPNIGDYILVYSYDNNMNGSEVEKIKEYAKKKNLKIVSAGFYHKWCDRNINCDPLELLGYFKYADFVITDTFHGSVMSLITNANFMVTLRDNTQKLKWLLQEYNLLDRISDKLNDIENLHLNPIDFTKVNDLIISNRENSLTWLRGAIGE